MPSPLPVLRLISVCDALEWRHLPVAGGIYDQHPEFIEAMLLYKELRSREEERKRKDEEEKNKRQMGSHKGRR